MHVAKEAYKELYTSAVCIQTGMRGMAACAELWFRRRTSAPIVIQEREATKGAMEREPVIQEVPVAMEATKASLMKKLSTENEKLKAPSTSKRTSRSGLSSGKDSPMVHWQSIIESLNNLLGTLKENFVPPFLIQNIFSQTFSCIDVQLFNSLLLHHDCCTFSYCEYVKAGLAELELWCCQAKEEYAGSSWDELKHIRQAVGLLVLSSMRMLMAEDSNNAQNDSFSTSCWMTAPGESACIWNIFRWRFDNISGYGKVDISFNFSCGVTTCRNIPFSVGDLSISLQEKDFSDMNPPDELLENPAFQFSNE